MWFWKKNKSYVTTGSNFSNKMLVIVWRQLHRNTLLERVIAGQIDTVV